MNKKINCQDYYGALLQGQEKEFYETLKTRPKRSLRVNTLKIEIASFKKLAKKHGLILEQIPWCKEGFWYEINENSECRKLGNSFFYEDSLVYIQDATSMLPVSALDPKPGEIVLDLAAAPGGKTTHIAQRMKNSGMLIANEVVEKRAQTLKMMLAKYGVYNASITSYDPSFFAKFYPNHFDKIILDAPCSGEGMRSIGYELENHFSMNRIKFNAKRQKRILNAAFDSLKEGGTIVYSTCAMAIEENEEVINDLLIKKEEQAKLIKIKKPDARAIIEYGGKELNPEITKTIRLWPHLFNTNGFYVAAIKKTKASALSPKKFQTKESRKETWNPIPRKLGLQYLNHLSKHYNIKDFFDNKEFQLITHKDELWLQPNNVNQLKKMRILYSGIRIARISKDQEISLNEDFQKAFQIKEY